MESELIHGAAPTAPTAFRSMRNHCQTVLEFPASGGEFLDVFRGLNMTCVLVRFAGFSNFSSDVKLPK
jgi:hypothetical protein